MLGHIGLNVPDLAVAKTYDDALMPALGFTEYFQRDGGRVLVLALRREARNVHLLLSGE